MRAAPRGPHRSVRRFGQRRDREELDRTVVAEPKPHPLTEPEEAQSGGVERASREGQRSAVVEQQVAGAGPRVEATHGRLHRPSLGGRVFGPGPDQVGEAGEHRGGMATDAERGCRAKVVQGVDVPTHRRPGHRCEIACPPPAVAGKRA